MSLKVKSSFKIFAIIAVVGTAFGIYYMNKPAKTSNDTTEQTATKVEVTPSAPVVNTTTVEIPAPPVVPVPPVTPVTEVKKVEKKEVSTAKTSETKVSKSKTKKETTSTKKKTEDRENLNVNFN